MPVEWITPPATPEQDAPLKQVHLWPYRSLLRRDFVTFIAGTLALVLLPMLAVLGSPVLWGLLPFFAIAIAGMWYALHRSYKDGEILEDLSIWHDRITLEHHDPRKGHHVWEANPYWVQVKIDPHNDRIPNYVTLKGNDREVEIGTFLSEDERAVLYDELTHAIRDVLNASQT